MVKIIEFQDKNKLYITDSVDEYLKLISQGLSVVPEIYYTNTNDRLSDSDINGVIWPHTDIIVTESECISIEEFYKIYQRINHIPWTILKTNRTYVRETTVEDVDAFYDIYSDPSVTQYTDNLFDNPKDEREYTRQYIKDVYEFYGYGIWTVVNKLNNDIIGRAGISMIEGAKYPELGFLTANKYQHQGLTYEVTSEIIQYAKNELGMKTLQARVKPNNIKSIDLLKRLGFNIPHTPYQGYLVALRTLS